jgi:O-antigen/teichoic acid export membrane protein
LLKSASILSNITWLGLANILQKPVWIVFTIATVRYFGAEKLGIFVFLLTLGTILATILDLGIDLHTTRSIAKEREKSVLFISTSLPIKLAGILAIVLAAPVLYMAFFSVSYDFSIYAQGILSGILMYILNHLRSIFRGLELLKYEAYSILIERFSIALLCFVVLFTTNDLLTYFILYNAGIAIAITIAIFHMYGIYKDDTMVRADFNSSVSYVKEAIPFGLLNIMLSIYSRLGTLLLERISGNSAWVGFHNAGARFMEGFVVIPYTVSIALYPVFCRIYHDRDALSNLVNIASRLMLSVAVPVGTVIFIAHQEFTLLLLGTDYVEASHAMRYFGLSLIVMSQVYIAGIVVSATGNQPIANRYTAIVFAISIALYLIFIPKYGFLAAAIITCLDQVALLVLNYIVARSFYNVKEYALNLVKAMIFPLLAYWGYSDLNLDVSDLTIVVMIVVWCFLGSFVVGLTRLADIKRLLTIRAHI